MKKRLALLWSGIFCGVLTGIFSIHLSEDPETDVPGELNQLDQTAEGILLRDHSLLTLGVVTSAKYLHTRCKVLRETWARDFQDKLFFVGDINNNLTALSEDVKELRGVEDDAYPPQHKVFSMLHYWYYNKLSEYKWFMRVDDDVYVDLEGVQAVLSKLDHTSSVYLGHPGYGRADGLYELFEQEPFCMGGPGVILSQGLLRMIGPKLSSCLQSVVTTHEDVEVGRCLKGLAHCTQSNEVKEWFVHGKKMFNVIFSSRPDRKKMGYSNILSYHPAKDMTTMRIVHMHFLRLKINKNMRKLNYYTQELKATRDNI